MRFANPMTVIGASMFFLGLIIFYSINTGQSDILLRTLKNIGTFVGLLGIGVFIAGALLFLINRNSPPIKETEI
jgi:hypothetical protein